MTRMWLRATQCVSHDHPTLSNLYVAHEQIDCLLKFVSNCSRNGMILLSICHTHNDANRKKNVYYASFPR